MWPRVLAAGLLYVLHGVPVVAMELNTEQQRLLDIYKELIEINTTVSVGDTTQASRAMAARLISAGFAEADVRIVEHPGNPRKGNLVARLRGDGSLKPILLLAHLDVVEADKADWSADLDPFKLIERDGFYYGRGTADDKAMAAIFVANLIRYRELGLKPKRDIILALTADEEGGDHNGVQWLIAHRRALIDAEFGINEGGGGRERKGKPLFNGVQASEKVYRDFQLEATNKGGHSSLPVKDNAIHHIAQAVDRVARFEFPVELNEVTRAFFEATAKLQSGPEGEDMRSIVQSNGTDEGAAKRLSLTPAHNAMLRTTCVATQVQGGHAPNALPQKATANVNCRILPGASVSDVEATLTRVVANDQIRITMKASSSGTVPPSPLKRSIMKPIEKLTEQLWPGVPTIPLMSTGATDGTYLRAAGIPIYGVSGLFGDMDDVRAHGRDERVGVRQLYEAQTFLFELIKQYATQKPVAD